MTRAADQPIRGAIHPPGVEYTEIKAFWTMKLLDNNLSETSTVGTIEVVRNFFENICSWKKIPVEVCDNPFSTIIAG